MGESLGREREVAGGLEAAWAPSSVEEVAVTVLLPVFNGERYLAEAAQSILEQSLRDLELLVVDDGSTDRTPRILHQLAARDARIARLTLARNRGLVAALNSGLERARGRYVARQDADDVSLPERLARQVEFLERHPEVGLLGTAYYRVDDRGRRLRTPPLTDVEIRWRLLFGNVFCHSSVMFRRELLEPTGPWYLDRPHAEDYDLWTRLMRRTQAANLRLPLVLYREHPASVLGRHGDTSWESARKIALREVRRLGLEPEVTAEELDDLRRCRAANPPTASDLAALPRLFALFDAYAATYPEQRIARGLRSRWVRRRFGRLPLAEWVAVARAGLLRLVAAREFAALAAGLLLEKPRRLFSPRLLRLAGNG